MDNTPTTSKIAGPARLFAAAALMFLMHIPLLAPAQMTAPGEPGGGQDAREQEAFERLKERFEKGQVFEARFTHSYTDSFTGDSSSDSGRIWVARGSYKVQTDNETVVVDGETSRVYDRNRNRVIISEYSPEEDDFAPSRILQGVDSTFAVKQEERRGDSIYILLASEDPFALYRQVEIWLSDSLTPQRIRAVDPADNVIATSFSEGAFAEPRPGTFRLDYPDSTEVIDMRSRTDGS